MEDNKNPVYAFEEAFKQRGYITVRRISKKEDGLEIFERRWRLYRGFIPVGRERIFVGEIILEKNGVESNGDEWRLESHRQNLTTLLGIASRVSVKYKHALTPVYTG